VEGELAATSRQMSLINGRLEHGELTLPADEQLGDLDEVSAGLGGESPADEAEEAAGPFEDAPDLADLEIEEKTGES